VPASGPRYDSAKTRDLLQILGYQAEIAIKASRRRSRPATLAGRAAALLDERLRQTPPLHRQAKDHPSGLPLHRRHADRDPPLDTPGRTHYRWPSRPTTRRLPLTIHCRAL
jgi:hypothetical protein